MGGDGDLSKGPFCLLLLFCEFVAHDKADETKNVVRICVNSINITLRVLGIIIIIIIINISVASRTSEQV